MKSIRLLSYCALFTGFLSAQGIINFSGGSFADWTSTHVFGDGSQTAVNTESGGNPGDAFRVVTSTNEVAITVHTNAANVYDPGNGAVDSIDFTIDYRIIFAFGQGMAYGIALEQDGGYFSADGKITGAGGSSWTTGTSLDLVQSDFGFLGGSNTMLDLSETGTPITFGFYTANDGGQAITIDYDNWGTTLETTPVPEPAAYALGFGIICMVILAYKRCIHHKALSNDNADQMRLGYQTRVI